MRRLRRMGWRLLPGGISSLAVVFLAMWGGWQPLEQAAYVALFRLRGALPWNDQVVVIEIDDASLRQLGRFPFSRQRYVQLLDRLSEAQPNIVAFDLIWSEPSPKDLQLKAAMERHGLVVLAEAWDGLGLPLSPTPDLEAGAIATGHILKHSSPDGLTHAINLQIQQKPALSVSVLQVYSLIQEPINLPDLNQPLRINWLSRVEQAPHYAFVDVIQGKVPLQAFQDKIVLVGVTATGLDPLVTPFDQDLPTSGVYLQATAINNLLQGNFLHVFAQRWVLFGLLLAGPVLSWCLSHWRTELQATVWLGLCLAWGIFGLLMFRANYWLPIASPIGLFTGTVVVVAVGDRLQLNRLLQQEIEHLWQSHYQDVVVSRKDTLPISDLPESPAALHRVTQLAELAEQFGRSQSAQAAIARSLPIGLLAADLNGQIWFCNPLAAKWLGVQVGDRLHSHLIPHWLSEAEWQVDLHSLKTSGFAQSRQLERGESCLEIKLEPLVYAMAPNSQTAFPLDGLLLVLNDITERQAIARMKDEFVSVVSHELRTPITSIRGSLGLLGTGKLGSLSDKGQRMLEIAINNTDRLIRLINDILDLERIESGKITLSKQPCDLADLIQQAAETMQTMADTAGVTLSVTAVSVRFMGDSDRLLQVFTNLLSNAIKFSPKGSTVWLTAEIQNQSAITHQPTTATQSPPISLQSPTPNPQSPISTLLIHIKDQGRGIPADKLNLIFERFQQVDVSDARQKGGTGLGLPICSAIVQQHDGKIWVESQLNVGSTFYVMLPGTMDV
ncbi:CHASE2 domain-containing protein [Leptolyngbya sp. FACHB-541]|uniref:CHASE2 domain-containing protein n=1 Tax=Leptolyngbya sp. FACHB-541 TaxID=2692810 RepID=UPI001683C604|nr:CHASE2 domain-containing protein [Leptolyngbya sp. FACHB-541]MBD1996888.1 CHASE2 domain-containing protein [Leptolyngbya sp. FACHB-541]